MGNYGHNHGDFGWNELATPEPGAAVKFYTKLFGWKCEAMPMPGMDGMNYNVLWNGEERIAGITAPMPGEGWQGPPKWTPYITVDDVDATAAQVTELGGKILVPVTEIPEIGRFTLFLDPQGTVLAAITYMGSGECN